jgi:hypothetical protein
VLLLEPAASPIAAKGPPSSYALLNKAPLLPLFKMNVIKAHLANVEQVGAACALNSLRWQDLPLQLWRSGGAAATSGAG